MSVPESLAARMGKWSGVNRLWLRPDQDPAESPGTITIRRAARDKFASLTYSWSYEGEEQEGLILLSLDNHGRVDAAWIDSWHMSHHLMACEGSIGDDGSISFKGSYPAPPDPDWGWRTVIEPGADSVKMIMYNISPAGEEFLAVEAVYERE